MVPVADWKLFFFIFLLSIVLTVGLTADSVIHVGVVILGFVLSFFSVAVFFYVSVTQTFYSKYVKMPQNIFM